MPALDFDACAREASAVLGRLDQLRLELEAMQREVARVAEQEARKAVVNVVAPEKQAEAQQLVTRGVRIADEVGAWLVGRSPLGLAQRLIPELKAGVDEVQAFLAAPAAPRKASSFGAGSSGPTPPTTARPAP